MCGYAHYFCWSSKTLCNISNFPILAEKAVSWASPRSQASEGFLLGFMGNIGRPSSAILLLCTSPHGQMLVVAQRDETVGRVGRERKAVNRLKRAVSLIQRTCGCQLKQYVCLFSLCLVPLISFSFSCSFSFDSPTSFFFLCLPTKEMRR